MKSCNGTVSVVPLEAAFTVFSALSLSLSLSGCQFEIIEGKLINIAKGRLFLSADTTYVFHRHSETHGLLGFLINEGSLLLPPTDGAEEETLLFTI